MSRQGDKVNREQAEAGFDLSKRRASPKQPLNIEAAAKTLASCMDYPWEHMPEQGREEMRKHAKAVIEAAMPKP
jgi:hypothetical protein